MIDPTAFRAASRSASAFSGDSHPSVPARHQCTASLGRRGRCPNDSTMRYRMTNIDATAKPYWLNRCAEHPMATAIDAEPIESELSTEIHIST